MHRECPRKPNELRQSRAEQQCRGTTNQIEEAHDALRPGAVKAAWTYQTRTNPMQKQSKDTYEASTRRLWTRVVPPAKLADAAGMYTLKNAGAERDSLSIILC